MDKPAGVEECRAQLTAQQARIRAAADELLQGTPGGSSATPRRSTPRAASPPPPGRGGDTCQGTSVRYDPDRVRALERGRTRLWPPTTSPRSPTAIRPRRTPGQRRGRAARTSLERDLLPLLARVLGSDDTMQTWDTTSAAIGDGPGGGRRYSPCSPGAPGARPRPGAGRERLPRSFADGDSDDIVDLTAGLPRCGRRRGRGAGVLRRARGRWPRRPADVPRHGPSSTTARRWSLAATVRARLGKAAGAALPPVRPSPPSSSSGCTEIDDDEAQPGHGADPTSSTTPRTARVPRRDDPRPRRPRARRGGRRAAVRRRHVGTDGVVRPRIDPRPRARRRR